MRRFSFVFSLILIALLGVATAGRSAFAQDDTTSDEVHPIVGAWIVIDDSGDESTPSIVTFSDDGTVVDLEVGFTTAGVWESTGDNTADATFAGFAQFEGFEGSIVIRISAEVDESDAFSADYSVTAVNADGSVLFSDTGTVSGTRMDVEPVDNGGQPLDNLPTWVSSAEGDEEGTPAAS
jgi:hypothetical protein